MTTYKKSDPSTIQKMFGSIASDYDRTNGILSFQMHRYWNYRLIRQVLVNRPNSLLDLCSGTGEIAIGFLKKSATPCHAYLLDFCPEMLACAKEKTKEIKKHQIAFIEGDAQVVPLSDECVEAVTIAYGIRNAEEPIRCFQEAWRVLKPHGRFAILELTRPNNRVLRFGHKFYLERFLPLLGKISTSNKQAYEYLCNSVQSFVDPSILKEQLLETGFKNVRVIPLVGGIATIITADKI